MISGPGSVFSLSFFIRFPKLSWIAFTAWQADMIEESLFVSRHLYSIQL